MQRTWKQSPSHYTTYVYTQKAPLQKITRSYMGRPLRLPWIRHCWTTYVTTGLLHCDLNK